MDFTRSKLIHERAMRELQEKVNEEHLLHQQQIRKMEATPPPTTTHTVSLASNMSLPLLHPPPPTRSVSLPTCLCHSMHHHHSPSQSRFQPFFATPPTTTTHPVSLASNMSLPFYAPPPLTQSVSLPTCLCHSTHHHHSPSQSRFQHVFAILCTTTTHPVSLASNLSLPLHPPPPLTLSVSLPTCLCHSMHHHHSPSQSRFQPVFATPPTTTTHPVSLAFNMSLPPHPPPPLTQSVSLPTCLCHSMHHHHSPSQSRFQHVFATPPITTTHPVSLASNTSLPFHSPPPTRSVMLPTCLCHSTHHHHHSPSQSHFQHVFATPSPTTTHPVSLTSNMSLPLHPSPPLTQSVSLPTRLCHSTHHHLPGQSCFQHVFATPATTTTTHPVSLTSNMSLPLLHPPPLTQSVSLPTCLCHSSTHHHPPGQSRFQHVFATPPITTHPVSLTSNMSLSLLHPPPLTRSVSLPTCLCHSSTHHHHSHGQSRFQHVFAIPPTTTYPGQSHLQHVFATPPTTTTHPDSLASNMSLPFHPPLPLIQSVSLPTCLCHSSTHHHHSPRQSRFQHVFAIPPTTTTHPVSLASNMSLPLLHPPPQLTRSVSLPTCLCHSSTHHSPSQSHFQHVFVTPPPTTHPVSLTSNMSLPLLHPPLTQSVSLPTCLPFHTPPPTWSVSLPTCLCHSTHHHYSPSQSRFQHVFATPCPTTTTHPVSLASNMYLPLLHPPPSPPLTRSVSLPTCLCHSSTHHSPSQSRFQHVFATPPTSTHPVSLASNMSLPRNPPPLTQSVSLPTCLCHSTHHHPSPSQSRFQLVFATPPPTTTTHPVSLASNMSLPLHPPPPLTQSVSLPTCLCHSSTHHHSPSQSRFQHVFATPPPTTTHPVSLASNMYLPLLHPPPLTQSVSHPTCLCHSSTHHHSPSQSCFQHVFATPPPTTTHPVSLASNMSLPLLHPPPPTRSVSLPTCLCHSSTHNHPPGQSRFQHVFATPPTTTHPVSLTSNMSLPLLHPPPLTRSVSLPTCLCHSSTHHHHPPGQSRFQHVFVTPPPTTTTHPVSLASNMSLPLLHPPPPPTRSVSLPTCLCHSTHHHLPGQSHLQHVFATPPTTTTHPVSLASNMSLPFYAPPPLTQSVSLPTCLCHSSTHNHHSSSQSRFQHVFATPPPTTTTTTHPVSLASNMSLPLLHPPLAQSISLPTCICHSTHLHSHSQSRFQHVFATPPTTTHPVSLASNMSLPFHLPPPLTRSVSLPTCLCHSTHHHPSPSQSRFQHVFATPPPTTTTTTHPVSLASNLSLSLLHPPPPLTRSVSLPTCLCHSTHHHHSPSQSRFQHVFATPPSTTTTTIITHPVSLASNMSLPLLHPPPPPPPSSLTRSVSLPTCLCHSSTHHHSPSQSRIQHVFATPPPTTTHPVSLASNMSLPLLHPPPLTQSVSHPTCICHSSTHHRSPSQSRIQHVFATPPPTTTHPVILASNMSLPLLHPPPLTQSVSHPTCLCHSSTHHHLPGQSRFQHVFATPPPTTTHPVSLASNMSLPLHPPPLTQSVSLPTCLCHSSTHHHSPGQSRFQHVFAIPPTTTYPVSLTYNMSLPPHPPPPLTQSVSLPTCLCHSMHHHHSPSQSRFQPVFATPPPTTTTHPVSLASNMSLPLLHPPPPPQLTRSVSLPTCLCHSSTHHSPSQSRFQHVFATPPTSTHPVSLASNMSLPRHPPPLTQSVSLPTCLCHSTHHHPSPSQSRFQHVFATPPPTTTTTTHPVSLASNLSLPLLHPPPPLTRSVSLPTCLCHSTHHHHSPSQSRFQHVFATPPSTTTTTTIITHPVSLASNMSLPLLHPPPPPPPSSLTWSVSLPTCLCHSSTHHHSPSQSRIQHVFATPPPTTTHPVSLASNMSLPLLHPPPLTQSVLHPTCICHSSTHHHSPSQSRIQHVFATPPPTTTHPVILASNMSLPLLHPPPLTQSVSHPTCLCHSSTHHHLPGQSRFQHVFATPPPTTTHPVSLASNMSLPLHPPPLTQSVSLPTCLCHSSTHHHSPGQSRFQHVFATPPPTTTTHPVSLASNMSLPLLHPPQPLTRSVSFQHVFATPPPTTTTHTVSLASNMSLPFHPPPPTRSVSLTTCLCHPTHHHHSPSQSRFQHVFAILCTTTTHPVSLASNLSLPLLHPQPPLIQSVSLPTCLCHSSTHHHHHNSPGQSRFQHVFATPPPTTHPVSLASNMSLPLHPPPLNQSVLLPTCLCHSSTHHHSPSQSRFQHVFAIPHTTTYLVSLTSNMSLPLHPPPLLTQSVSLPTCLCHSLSHHHHSPSQSRFQHVFATPCPTTTTHPVSLASNMSLPLLHPPPLTRLVSLPTCLCHSSTHHSPSQSSFQHVFAIPPTTTTHPVSLASNMSLPLLHPQPPTRSVSLPTCLCHSTHHHSPSQSHFQHVFATPPPTTTHPVSLASNMSLPFHPPPPTRSVSLTTCLCHPTHHHHSPSQSRFQHVFAILCTTTTHPVSLASNLSLPLLHPQPPLIQSVSLPTCLCHSSTHHHHHNSPGQSRFQHVFATPPPTTHPVSLASNMYLPLHPPPLTQSVSLPTCLCHATHHHSPSQSRFQHVFAIPPTTTTHPVSLTSNMSLPLHPPPPLTQSVSLPTCLCHSSTHHHHHHSPSQSRFQLVFATPPPTTTTHPVSLASNMSLPLHPPPPLTQSVSLPTCLCHSSIHHHHHHHHHSPGQSRFQHVFATPPSTTTTTTIITHPVSLASNMSLPLLHPPPLTQSVSHPTCLCHSSTHHHSPSQSRFQHVFATPPPTTTHPVSLASNMYLPLLHPPPLTQSVSHPTCLCHSSTHHHSPSHSCFQHVFATPPPTTTHPVSLASNMSLPLLHPPPPTRSVSLPTCLCHSSTHNHPPGQSRFQHVFATPPTTTHPVSLTSNMSLPLLHPPPLTRSVSLPTCLCHSSTHHHHPPGQSRFQHVFATPPPTTTTHPVSLLPTCLCHSSTHHHHSHGQSRFQHVFAIPPTTTYPVSLTYNMSLPPHPPPPLTQSVSLPTCLCHSMHHHHSPSQSRFQPVFATPPPTTTTHPVSLASNMSLPLLHPPLTQSVSLPTCLCHSTHHHSTSQSCFQHVFATPPTTTHPVSLASNMSLPLLHSPPLTQSVSLPTCLCHSTHHHLPGQSHFQHVFATPPTTTTHPVSLASNMSLPLLVPPPPLTQSVSLPTCLCHSLSHHHHSPSQSRFQHVFATPPPTTITTTHPVSLTSNMSLPLLHPPLTQSVSLPTCLCHSTHHHHSPSQSRFQHVFATPPTTTHPVSLASNMSSTYHHHSPGQSHFQHVFATLPTTTPHPVSLASNLSLPLLHPPPPLTDQSRFQHVFATPPTTTTHPVSLASNMSLPLHPPPLTQSVSLPTCLCHSSTHHHHSPGQSRFQHVFATPPPTTTHPVSLASNMSLPLLHPPPPPPPPLTQSVSLPTCLCHSSTHHSPSQSRIQHVFTIPPPITTHPVSLASSMSLPLLHPPSLTQSVSHPTCLCHSSTHHHSPSQSRFQHVFATPPPTTTHPVSLAYNISLPFHPPPPTRSVSLTTCLCHPTLHHHSPSQSRFQHCHSTHHHIPGQSHFQHVFATPPPTATTYPVSLASNMYLPLHPPPPPPLTQSVSLPTRLCHSTHHHLPGQSCVQHVFATPPTTTTHPVSLASNMSLPLLHPPPPLTGSVSLPTCLCHSSTHHHHSPGQSRFQHVFATPPTTTHPVSLMSNMSLPLLHSPPLTQSVSHPTCVYHSSTHHHSPSQSRVQHVFATPPPTITHPVSLASNMSLPLLHPPPPTRSVSLPTCFCHSSTHHHPPGQCHFQHVFAIPPPTTTHPVSLASNMSLPLHHHHSPSQSHFQHVFATPPPTTTHPVSLTSNMSLPLLHPPPPARSVSLPTGLCHSTHHHPPSQSRFQHVFATPPTTTHPVSLTSNMSLPLIHPPPLTRSVSLPTCLCHSSTHHSPSQSRFQHVFATPPTTTQPVSLASNMSLPLHPPPLTQSVSLPTCLCHSSTHHHSPSQSRFQHVFAIPHTTTYLVSLTSNMSLPLHPPPLLTQSVSLPTCLCHSLSHHHHSPSQSRFQHVFATPCPTTTTHPVSLASNMSLPLLHPPPSPPLTRLVSLPTCLCHSSTHHSPSQSRFQHVFATPPTTTTHPVSLASNMSLPRHPPPLTQSVSLPTCLPPTTTTHPVSLTSNMSLPLYPPPPLTQSVSLPTCLCHSSTHHHHSPISLASNMSLPLHPPPPLTQSVSLPTCLCRSTHHHSPSQSRFQHVFATPPPTTTTHPVSLASNMSLPLLHPPPLTQSVSLPTCLCHSSTHHHHHHHHLPSQSRFQLVFATPPPTTHPVSLASNMCLPFLHPSPLTQSVSRPACLCHSSTHHHSPSQSRIQHVFATPPPTTTHPVSLASNMSLPLLHPPPLTQSVSLPTCLCHSLSHHHHSPSQSRFQHVFATPCPTTTTHPVSLASNMSLPLLHPPPLTRLVSLPTCLCHSSTHHSPSQSSFQHVFAIPPTTTTHPVSLASNMSLPLLHPQPPTRSVSLPTCLCHSTHHHSPSQSHFQHVFATPPPTTTHPVSLASNMSLPFHPPPPTRSVSLTTCLCHPTHHHHSPSQSRFQHVFAILCTTTTHPVSLASNLSLPLLHPQPPLIQSVSLPTCLCHSSTHHHHHNSPGQSRFQHVFATPPPTTHPVSLASNMYLPLHPPPLTQSVSLPTCLCHATHHHSPSQSRFQHVFAIPPTTTTHPVSLTSNMSLPLHPPPPLTQSVSLPTCLCHSSTHHHHHHSPSQSRFQLVFATPPPTTTTHPVSLASNMSLPLHPPPPLTQSVSLPTCLCHSSIHHHHHHHHHSPGQSRFQHVFATPPSTTTTTTIITHPVSLASNMSLPLLHPPPLTQSVSHPTCLCHSSTHHHSPSQSRFQHVFATPPPTTTHPVSLASNMYLPLLHPPPLTQSVSHPTCLCHSSTHHHSPSHSCFQHVFATPPPTTTHPVSLASNMSLPLLHPPPPTRSVSLPTCLCHSSTHNHPPGQSRFQHVFATPPTTTHPVSLTSNMSLPLLHPPPLTRSVSLPTCLCHSSTHHHHPPGQSRFQHVFATPPPTTTTHPVSLLPTCLCHSSTHHHHSHGQSRFQHVFAIPPTTTYPVSLTYNMSLPPHPPPPLTQSVSLPTCLCHSMHHHHSPSQSRFQPVFATPPPTTTTHPVSLASNMSLPLLHPPPPPQLTRSVSLPTCLCHSSTHHSPSQSRFQHVFATPPTTTQPVSLASNMSLPLHPPPLTQSVSLPTCLCHSSTHHHSPSQSRFQHVFAIPHTTTYLVSLTSNMSLPLHPPPLLTQSVSLPTCLCHSLSHHHHSPSQSRFQHVFATPCPTTTTHPVSLASNMSLPLLHPPPSPPLTRLVSLPTCLCHSSTHHSPSQSRFQHVFATPPTTTTHPVSLASNMSLPRHPPPLTQSVSLPTCLPPTTTTHPVSLTSNMSLPLYPPPPLTQSVSLPTCLCHSSTHHHHSPISLASNMSLPLHPPPPLTQSVSLPTCLCRSTHHHSPSQSRFQHVFATPPPTTTTHPVSLASNMSLPLLHPPPLTQSVSLPTCLCHSSTHHHHHHHHLPSQSRFQLVFATPPPTTHPVSLASNMCLPFLHPSPLTQSVSRPACLCHSSTHHHSPSQSRIQHVFATPPPTTTHPVSLASNMSLPLLHPPPLTRSVSLTTYLCHSTHHHLPGQSHLQHVFATPPSTTTHPVSLAFNIAIPPTTTYPVSLTSNMSLPLLHPPPPPTRSVLLPTCICHSTHHHHHHSPSQSRFQHVFAIPLTTTYPVSHASNMSLPLHPPPLLTQSVSLPTCLCHSSTHHHHSPGQSRFQHVFATPPPTTTTHPVSLASNMSLPLHPPPLTQSVSCPTCLCHSSTHHHSPSQSRIQHVFTIPPPITTHPVSLASSMSLPLLHPPSLTQSVSHPTCLCHSSTHHHPRGQCHFQHVFATPPPTTTHPVSVTSNMSLPFLHPPPLTRSVSHPTCLCHSTTTTHPVSLTSNMSLPLLHPPPLTRSVSLPTCLCHSSTHHHLPGQSRFQQVFAIPPTTTHPVSLASNMSLPLHPPPLTRSVSLPTCLCHSSTHHHSPGQSRFQHVFATPPPTTHPVSLASNMSLPLHPPPLNQSVLLPTCLCHSTHHHSPSQSRFQHVFATPPLTTTHPVSLASNMSLPFHTPPPTWSVSLPTCLCHSTHHHYSPSQSRFQHVFATPCPTTTTHPVSLASNMSLPLLVPPPPLTQSVSLPTCLCHSSTHHHHHHSPG